MGRYSGPLGKQFSGDRDMAMSLQSRARTLVQQLFDKIKADPFKGKGSMHHQWNMEDGSVVHAYVNTLGVWPIVRTWIESPIHPEHPPLVEPVFAEAFLESGYLMIPYFLENTTQESRLYYPEMSVYKAYQAKEFINWARISNSNGKIVGPSRVVDYVAGMPALSFPTIETSQESYRKIVSLIFNANFDGISGKLKLFAQCYWGRMDPYQEEYAADGIGNTFDPAISGLFAPGNAVSYGLLTTENFDYKIVRISRNTIDIADVLFRDSATKILDILRASGSAPRTRQQTSKAEAYLFTQFKELSAFTTVLSFAEMIGYGLNYGWAFDWKGREARIVTHARTEEGSKSAYWTARAYRCTLTVGANGAVSAAVALEEEAKWNAYPWEGAIWVPTASYGETSSMNTSFWWMIDCGDYIYAVDIPVSDVPIYGFYDVDGEYNQVRFRRHTTKEKGVYSDYGSYSNPADLLYDVQHDWEFCAAGTYGPVTWSHQHQDRVEHGFYIVGPLSRSAFCVSGSWHTDYTYSVELQDPGAWSAPESGSQYYVSSAYGVCSSLPAYGSLPTAYVVRRASAIETLISEQVDEESGHSVLVIPAHDSESVYIGRKTTKQQLSNNTTTKTLTLPHEAKGVWYSNGQISAEGSVVTRHWDYTNTFYQFQNLPDQTITNDDGFFWLETRLDFVYAGGEKEIYSLPETRYVGNSDPAFAMYDSLFEPAFCSPYFDDNLLQTFRVQFSALGNELIYTGGFSPGQQPEKISTFSLAQTDLLNGHFTGWV